VNELDKPVGSQFTFLDIRVIAHLPAEQRVEAFESVEGVTTRVASGWEVLIPLVGRGSGKA